MTGLNHGDYVRLVEQSYFGNVVAEDIDAVMACFVPDAAVTIRHGDAEPRYFRADGASGASPLREFYEHLCGNYHAWFGDYTHYVDAENDRCASTFTVKLTPKEGSPYKDGGTQTLQNCNFFLCRDGLIADMTIYYSNPEAGQRGGVAATGYPQKS